MSRVGLDSHVLQHLHKEEEEEEKEEESLFASL